MHISCILVLFCLCVVSSLAQYPPQSVTNGLITLGISGTTGGAIDNLQYNGVNVLDTFDFGRYLQSSIYIKIGADIYWSHDTGSRYGARSVLWQLTSIPQLRTLIVGDYPKDWEGAVVPGVRLEGYHQLSPLPYLNNNSAIQLNYRILNFGGREANVVHTILNSYNQTTIFPYLPAIYFKGNVLNRLYGLDATGKWQDVTSITVVDYQGLSHPSLYYFRAMAWVSSTAGWGVGLYGRSTLTQTCPPSQFDMAIPSQKGWCPNFAAEIYPNSSPNGGTNFIGLLDTTFGSISPGASSIFQAHLVVGSLASIAETVNSIYNSGW